MSTRSLIGYKENGKCNMIFCHWDGCVVNGVGEILLLQYQDVDKIKELVSLGGVDRLGAELECIPYVNKFKNTTDAIRSVLELERSSGERNKYTVAYERDIVGGEKSYIIVDDIFNEKELIEERWIAYTYLYDVECDVWYVKPTNGEKIALTKAIMKECEQILASK